MIGKKPMGDLAKRPLLVQQWVRTLRDKGLAPQYIRHIVATLSQIFIVAVDNGIVTRNPVDSPTVKPPKVSPRAVQPWTLGQVRAAAEHLGNAMPYLGAGAGLRQGEIFGIADEDIKFLDGVIEVRRQVRTVSGVPCFCPPKRDKIRDVPLSEKLAERVQTQIQDSPPVAVTLPWGDPDGELITVDLLFTRPGGKPYHRQCFGYTWQDARAAAGAAPTRANGMHVLRHAFAAACLANGVDVRTLADWLGHADPGFTLRVYGHLMPSAEARGRKAIDAFLREQSAPNVPSED